MSSSMFMRRAAFGARAFSTSTPRSIARISIIGNLSDSPELVATSTGREIVRYSVASNTGPRDNRQTSWFRVTSFTEGPQRDYLLGLPKGIRRTNIFMNSSTVFVEGNASISTYQDAEGKTRSGLNVTQRSIEVLKRTQVPGQ